VTGLYRLIACCVDDSDAAAGALAESARLAALAGARLAAVHVVESPEKFIGGRTAFMADPEELARGPAGSHLVDVGPQRGLELRSEALRAAMVEVVVRGRALQHALDRVLAERLVALGAVVLERHSRLLSVGGAPAPSLGLGGIVQPLVTFATSCA